MQRKNYFLKTSTLKHRNGMAMIMAIAVIVVLATIMALSLSLTTLTTKRTTDLYLYEQAVLYSKSVAELALLDIAKEGCANSRNYSFDSGLYDANVTMLYVYTEANTNVAGTTNCTPYTKTPSTPSYISTPEQNGSVLMDITVSTDAGTEPIRYFRRSIQKL